MAIRDEFEVAAGQVRAAVQRFALGLLVIAAFGAMLVGKADTVLVEHARVLALDLASPVLEAIARPVAVANRTIADLKEFASLREENARLREENARLLAWQTAARRLENENEGLRGLANFREGPEASFITARIVGDSVSAYVRGALLNVGRKVGVASGQAVVTGEGLAGRIAEVGDNSSRVLFVTDVNSRLPVLIERTRERAILAGDNSSQLRLTLLQSLAGRAARRSHHHLGPRRQLPGRHPGRRGGRDRRGPRARAAVRRLLAARVRARRRLRRDRPGERRPGHAVDAVGSGRPEGAMKAP